MLVQPTKSPTTPAEETSLLADIWPTIQQAVEEGPVSGKIVQGLVVLTTEGKPMPLAGAKGTVQRRQAIDLYQEEINQKYLDLANVSLTKSTG